MRLRTLCLAAAAATATLAACNSDETLAVPNLDNPDVARSLSTPDGIHAILRNGFNQVYGATHGTTTALWPMLTTMAFESYGSVANFGMNLRANMPRAVIDNAKGNSTQGENLRDFQQLSMRGRLVANAITALDSLLARDLTLGTPADNFRARSFGFFALGLANGNLALIYDSVAVVRPGLLPEEIPELVGYREAMDEALKQLDTAIAIANAATAAGASFTIPNDFLRLTSSPMSQAEYVRVLRSLKARLRAGVARTPSDRAAVDWAAVEADAANGITQDVTLDLNSAQGWGNSWISQAAAYSGWHNQPYHVIGMADTSSGYATWNAQARGQKAQFTILTPDLRLPRGDTRAAQQASSPPASSVLPTVYWRNRTGGDTPGDAWGVSQYDHVRFRHYRQQSSVGPWVWMDKTEIDMLRAEALIRLGRDAEAVALVNVTRTANGLPAFPAGADSATRAPAHPGGSATSCVPRTPTGPAYALECGTLWEAMKYEKRMETAFTGYAQWFIDSRGWGDLPEATPTTWPVPFQEMDARQKPFYNSLSEWGAGVSTYGWGTDTR